MKACPFPHYSTKYCWPASKRRPVSSEFLFDSFEMRGYDGEGFGEGGRHVAGVGASS
jgi:hypothetical protein